jgi:ATP-dependent protease HslVU (ClpYQ) peptidase subunit
MTTIAALHTPGYGTLIASDTQLTDSTGFKMHMMRMEMGKWIGANGWYFGISGEFALFNALTPMIHDMTEGVRDERDFLSRMFEVLKDKSFDFRQSDISSPSFGGGYLLVNNSRVWQVDGTMASLEIESDYLIAQGSGSELAIGAGYALRSMADPVLRIRAAMETALRFDVYTGGRIIINLLPEIEEIVIPEVAEIVKIS